MDPSHAQIRKIAREVNKLAIKTLRQDGIGTSEFDLIHVVRKHDGISQAHICRILGTDKAAVARQVASLSKKGYLKKDINPKDGRASLIYPTKKAEELKISKRHVETAYYEYILKALSAEEKETFCFLLDKVYCRSKEESKSGFVHVRARIGEGE